MDYGLILPSTTTTSRTKFAQRAESRGFKSVWIGELWGENAFAHLAEIATVTEEVTIGPSIVNVFSRTPAVLAMGAYSIDRISNGRAALGVGVSTAKAIESIHDLKFSQPVRRTHETIELVKRFLDGSSDAVEYDGELFSVEDGPSLDADVPIYNAALGPANRRATGRVADGWTPYNVPFSKLDEAFETVAQAARERGRDPADISVKPRVNVLVGEDRKAARDGIRDIVAYYVGSGDGYKNAVGSVYPDEAETIASEWRSGQRDAARAAVTDQMVQDLGVAGSADAVRDRLRTLVETTVIDVPLLDIPAHLDDEVIERTFMELSPTL